MFRPSKNNNNNPSWARFADPHEILMNAPVGFFTTTPDGRYLSVNNTLARMHGYDSPGQLMDSITDVASQIYVDPSDRDKLKRLLEKYGKVTNYECRLLHRSGRTIWVSENISVIKDEDGNIIGYQGFNQDITHRKQAEKALEESEKKYREILSAMQEGYYQTDLAGNIIFCNAATASMLGHTLDSCIGLNFREVCKQPLKVFRNFHKVYKSGLPVKALPVEVVRKDGSTGYGELSIAPINDGKDQCVGFRGVARDITERKEMEDSLLQSEIRARAQRKAIVDLSLDKEVNEGVLSTALDRITETVSKSMNIARAGIWMLSHDRSELRCLSLYEAGPARHSRGMVLKTTAFPRYFEAILLESRIYAHDAQNDPRTSELCDGYLLSLNITSMLDAGIQIDGRLAGVVCLEHIGKPRKWHSDEEAFVSTTAALVAQVVTNASRRLAEEEREKLQAQLLQAQKMESVGILAGGVAHDFNNLLHVMRGNIEMFMQGKSEDHPEARRLRVVTKSMDRAAKLVQQLLFFSRKSSSPKVHVDLNHEVESMARMLERTIPRMIALELHLDSWVWPLFADPVQIEQILLNLANNAVDAMPNGGRLCIETSNVELDQDFNRLHPGSSFGRHVLLTVTDTGCGMDKEVQEHVFDPFFTTKEVGKGTGLGLASVYGIVKGHGGYIQCYSELGQGTTFRVYLPAAEQRNMAAVKSRMKTTLQGGRETILVVDDEAVIRELTREALESLGYEVKSAATGEQALEVYREQGQTIDLVLLDLNMPGMGGYKCLQALLRLDPSVKVVIASGYTANGHGRDALSSGARGFIGKPYQLKELAAQIRDVLGND